MFDHLINFPYSKSDFAKRLSFRQKKDRALRFELTFFENSNHVQETLLMERMCRNKKRQHRDFSLYPFLPFCYLLDLEIFAKFLSLVQSFNPGFANKISFPVQSSFKLELRFDESITVCVSVDCKSVLSHRLCQLIFENVSRQIRKV